MVRKESRAAEHLGRTLTRCREESGLKKVELFRATGIDPSNLRAFEAGKGMPSVKTLVVLAYALGVKPAELLEGLTPEMFD